MFAPAEPAAPADRPAPADPAAPEPADRGARFEARVHRHGRRRAAVQTVRVARRIDQIFAVLLTLQWGVAVYLALWFTPEGWDPARHGVHPNVFWSALLGGLVNLVPVCLALRFEGRTVTRHAVAVAQIFYSGLLIHVTGGRIETHFHVFCSPSRSSPRTATGRCWWPPRCWSPRTTSCGAGGGRNRSTA